MAHYCRFYRKNHHRSCRGRVVPAFLAFVIGYYYTDALDLVSAWHMSPRGTASISRSRPQQRRMGSTTYHGITPSYPKLRSSAGSFDPETRQQRKRMDNSTSDQRKSPNVHLKRRKKQEAPNEIKSNSSKRGKPQTVSELVQTVRSNLRVNSRGSGDWRAAWVLLQREASTPQSSIDMNNINDDDHVTILPTRIYQEVLQSIAREKRSWKEAIRLVQYMERGNGGTEKVDASDMNDKESLVDKYNSRPWYIPSPTFEIYHTVIECCCASGQKDAHDASVYWLTKMLKRFEEYLSSMENELTNRDRKLVRNSIQAILSSFSKQRKWREALQLLDYSEILAEKAGLPLTVVQYNTVLSCLAKSKQAGHCQRLLLRLQSNSSALEKRDNLDRRSSKDLRPDEISYNAVVSACASVGRWKEALQVLEECETEEGIETTIYSYTNAIRACAKGGNTQKALSLLDVVKEKGLPIDSYCYTAVIDACAKGKQWKKALEIFDEMKDNNVDPTQVTYSALISALGNGLQWEKALQMLNLMRKKRMRVNLITYNAAITALAKSSKNRHSSRLYPSDNHASISKQAEDSIQHQQRHALWPKALELLTQMDEDGIEPDGFCYSSAINCCAADGRWKEACELIESMKKGGPKSRPNKIAYTAAISACGRAGRASKALELFQNMRDDGLSADRVAYNALFSALRVSEDADRAYELWGEICGTRFMDSNSIATAKIVASPDIITLTDCIATLSRAGYTRKMDEVFREGVELGIVLTSNDLDQQWEIDLSGLPFPIARAATRYLLQNIIENREESIHDDLPDLIFITGIGRAQQKRRQLSSAGSTQESSPNNNVLKRKDRTTSLRDFIQGILETDFDPPLESMVPQRAQGTVVVEKSKLSRWLNEEKGSVIITN